MHLALFDRHRHIIATEKRARHGDSVTVGSVATPM